MERDGLSARRMAVLWTFRESSLCRHVHHELMRSAVLNLTLIIPATACHQRNYVERYSRFTRGPEKRYHEANAAMPTPDRTLRITRNQDRIAAFHIPVLYRFESQAGHISLRTMAAVVSLISIWFLINSSMESCREHSR